MEKEWVSPRIFRVVALPAPTEREKSQMYAQRYLPQKSAGVPVFVVRVAVWRGTVVNANTYGGKGEPSARVLVLDLGM